MNEQGKKYFAADFCINGIRKKMCGFFFFFEEMEVLATMLRVV